MSEPITYDEDVNTVPGGPAAPPNASGQPAAQAQPDPAAVALEAKRVALQAKLNEGSVSNYLLYSSQARSFDAETAEYARYRDRITGFPNLDAKQRLYPGLYTIGAISSLGKTTLMYQMAEQVAAAGNDVLYISLEQSKRELAAKSMGRRIHQFRKIDPSYRDFTTADVRDGYADGSRELEEQKMLYAAETGGRMTVVDSLFQMDVDDIIALTELHMENARAEDARNHVPPRPSPVVFVDYLQIMAPPTINDRLITDQRTAIDYNVHRLKAFQAEHNLTFILICSLNRMNYAGPVVFESFKESGGIEYTCDVCWGLQLAVVSTKDFNTKTVEFTGKNGQSMAKEEATTEQEKRSMIDRAKDKSVRDVKLVCLKNRAGRPRYDVDFKYEPAYDTFTPVETWTEPPKPFSGPPRPEPGGAGSPEPRVLRPDEGIDLPAGDPDGSPAESSGTAPDGSAPQPEPGAGSAVLDPDGGIDLPDCDEDGNTVAPSDAAQAGRGTETGAHAVNADEKGEVDY